MYLASLTFYLFYVFYCFLCVCVCVCVCLCVCVELLYSCLTLWDPMDCSLQGSSVHGILQAKLLKWVAKPSSRGVSQPKD